LKRVFEYFNCPVVDFHLFRFDGSNIYQADTLKNLIRRTAKNRR